MARYYLKSVILGCLTILILGFFKFSFCNEINGYISDILQEGFSQVDLTNDGVAEKIFLRKTKESSVSKFIIVSSKGNLLFYLSNEGEFVQLYTDEQQVNDDAKKMNDSYQKLIQEKEASKNEKSPFYGQNIMAELSDEEKSVFHIDVPIEKTIQSIWEKKLVLIKNQTATKKYISGFLVYYAQGGRNKQPFITCYIANKEGKPVSDELTFRWNPKNKKFEQITPP